MKKYFVSVALLLFSGTIFLSPQVTALNKNPGLTISPLRSYPVQNPGQTTTATVDITNKTKVAASVSLSAVLFKTINENYDYAFTPAGSNNWIIFNDSNLNLRPNQVVRESYQIAVPADAKPGGYYFSIIAETKESAGQTKFTEVKQVASLIYLQVNGNITRKMTLLGTDIPWFSMSPNVSVSARVANQGTTHEEARVAMYVNYLPWGHTRAEPFLDNLILPATIRRMSGQINLGQIPGIYKVATAFSNTGGNVSHTSQKIIYIPFWFVAAVIMIAIYVLRKRRR